MKTTHRPRLRRAAIAVTAVAAIAMTGSVVAAQAATTDTASANLEARVKPLLTVDGSQFKDLNANGALDAYEDWRLPDSERVDDLVDRMTLHEKAGLMLINTMNATCDPQSGERGLVPTSGAALLQDQSMRRFIFRSVVADESAATCSSPTPSEAAKFTNSVQELSEASRLGIPSLFKSNARNHIDPDVRVGINEASGALTSFPKEAGLAAASLGEAAQNDVYGLGDMSVIEDFANVMGDEWSAIGVRGMYGYMADLSTEPRWYRTHETFTESADLNSEIMSTLVGTLQGPVDAEGVSLTSDSDVALTLKHFPGGGPQELGFDPHYSFGKTQVYPGNAFSEHLKPFQAAIDGGVSSIMPYYGIPIDVEYRGVQYNPVGMAFSDQIVNGLLRDQLGFRGYVNSDTGIINDRAWGLEEATVPERVAAAVNGGTDTLSGFSDAKVVTDLVEQGLVTEERVVLAAKRLLTPLFQLGLFEDPYVDEAAADGIVGSAASAERALDIQRKSLVLLQNDADAAGETTLPLNPQSKLYLLGGFDADTVSDYGYDVVDGNQLGDDGSRPSAEGSDYVVVSMTAKNAGTGSYDSRTAAENGPVNPIVADGIAGLDGTSHFGVTDACVSYGATNCTDNGLRFGGSLPWEGSILDFSGMAESESWQITPSLDVIQKAMAEVGDPSKVILNIYFRQPFVLDEASGLRDAGAIVAGFGADQEAFLDVLSGRFNPQGRMPFALAGTRAAVEQQFSDLPGYSETDDGALFEFGHGLSYLEVASEAAVEVRGKKGTLIVTVTNDETVPVRVVVDTPYGSKTWPVIQPGKSKSMTFNSKLAEMPAGEATVKATATIDGEQVATSWTLPYSASASR